MLLLLYCFIGGKTKTTQRGSKLSALEILGKKFEMKSELKKVELELKKKELELREMQMNREFEERKKQQEEQDKRRELEFAERKVFLELIQNMSSNSKK